MIAVVMATGSLLSLLVLENHRLADLVSQGAMPLFAGRVYAVALHEVRDSHFDIQQVEQLNGAPTRPCQFTDSSLDEAWMLKTGNIPIITVRL